MAKCPQLRRMGFLIGVTVRREKALDISGCNSTAFQYAPGSCSAGPAIKCWLLATVALRHNRNVNEAIARALTIFRESPELDDEGAFRALIDRGVERSIAARIVEFLPIAYCRVLLLNSGVQFSNSFVRAFRTLAGSPTSMPVAFASRCFTSGLSRWKTRSSVRKHGT